MAQMPLAPLTSHAQVGDLELSLRVRAIRPRPGGRRAWPAQAQGQTHRREEGLRQVVTQWLAGGLLDDQSQEHVVGVGVRPLRAGSEVQVFASRTASTTSARLALMSGPSRAATSSWKIGDSAGVVDELGQRHLSGPVRVTVKVVSDRVVEGEPSVLSEERDSEGGELLDTEPISKAVAAVIGDSGCRTASPRWLCQSTWPRSPTAAEQPGSMSACTTASSSVASLRAPRSGVGHWLRCGTGWLQPPMSRAQRTTTPYRQMPNPALHVTLSRGLVHQYPPADRSCRIAARRSPPVMRGGSGFRASSGDRSPDLHKRTHSGWIMVGECGSLLRSWR